MDEEKRLDEQLALSSILTNFSIVDRLRYKVLIPYDTSIGDDADEDTPYIHVDIRLPLSYPSQSPPLISWHPQTPWIDVKRVQNEVQTCFENAGGEVMLFEWVDWFSTFVNEAFQKYQDVLETQQVHRPSKEQKTMKK